MNNTWFISDTHFGHANILQYEPYHRPFKTVEEMNEAIIQRWNAVVSDSDSVYHLGDFSFGRHNLSLAQRLNGKKYLVLGNHDLHPISDYLKYFDRVFGAHYWHKCVLTHIPVHPSNLGSRALLNIHGHLHSKRVQREIFIPNEFCNHGEKKMIRDMNYYNVACEQNDLTPIHADLIRDHIKYSLGE